jgi:DNA mismatch repair protein MSH6
MLVKELVYEEACQTTSLMMAGASERVTFLYTLTPGACPKSYGMNVGRLAGLPPSIVSRAAECAARVEV